MASAVPYVRHQPLGTVRTGYAYQPRTVASQARLQAVMLKQEELILKQGKQNDELARKLNVSDAERAKVRRLTAPASSPAPAPAPSPALTTPNPNPSCDPWPVACHLPTDAPHPRFRVLRPRRRRARSS